MSDRYANGAVSGAIQAAMADNPNEGQDRLGARQRGGRWTVGGVRKLLQRSEAGQAFLDELEGTSAEIRRFKRVVSRTRGEDGRIVTTDLSDSLTGSTKGNLIRINSALSNEQAALTLYHEYQHFRGVTDEGQARILEEGFAISAGFNEASAGYRTSAGSVNSDLIRGQLAPGGVLNAHYASKTVSRTYSGEQNVDF